MSTALQEKLKDQLASSPGQSKDDVELILRLIKESGLYSSDDQLEGAVDEYKNGKPLAYITKTEQWVILLAKSILESIPPNTSIRVLDICTGSGCIPLLLASLGKGCIEVVGVDVDDRALEVARENAKRNGLEGVSRFEKLDLFDDRDIGSLRERVGGFDMIISNPPYVSSEDMKKVEGKWFEGKFALQGKLKGASVTDDSIAAENDDGYSFYRRIKSIYSTVLRFDREKGIPKLVLEIGSRQSSIVQGMYKDEGRIEVTKETERRKDVGAPKLEDGDMVGTERSIWIYQE